MALSSVGGGKDLVAAVLLGLAQAGGEGLYHTPEGHPAHVGHDLAHGRRGERGQAEGHAYGVIDVVPSLKAPNRSRRENQSGKQ